MATDHGIFMKDECLLAKRYLLLSGLGQHSQKFWNLPALLDPVTIIPVENAEGRCPGR